MTQPLVFLPLPRFEFILRKRENFAATSGFPPGSGSASNGGPTLSNDILANTILSSRTDDDLDDVVHRLKPSQLTLAVKQLVDHVRRIERKAELREELLKRSQKQIEFRDKAIKERDAEIRFIV